MKINNDKFFYVCIDCFYEINGFENEFTLDDKRELSKKSVANIPFILQKDYDFTDNPIFPEAGWQILTFLSCDCCGEPCHGHRIRYKIVGLMENH